MNTGLPKSIHSGEVWIWLTAGGLATALLLLLGLILLLVLNGLAGFWQNDVSLLQLREQQFVLGEIVERTIPEEQVSRIKIKQGNRDSYGQDFRWIDQIEVENVTTPPAAMLIERVEWGNFYGFALALKSDANASSLPASANDFDRQLTEALAATHRQQAKINDFEKGPLRKNSNEQVEVRRQMTALRYRGVISGPAVELLQSQQDQLNREFADLEHELDGLRSQLTAQLTVRTADQQELQIPLATVVRYLYPNQLGFSGKAWLYLQKLGEFLFGEPREANTEGGIFPAIFGTILMVIIMSVFVTPLGVLAAIYLHEYAKPGFFVTLVRIAVNNLAGVPSIVFGVFGVGFFIYGIGASIDQVFFKENLPSPTFGTGGILWAALTLVLLTLPTVIVTTEEGLSALPKHWREAAFALGATRFEAIWRVTIPALAPAILTSMILAVARGAGEVAPLMLTGVVKLAPALPLDGTFPFLHADRKFMHLGFHIYDLGFQAPNVDASRPMVYATALLLLLIVIALNSVAIIVRNRLNKRLHPGTI